MPMPNFFIVGAPKCGTTSLAQWLGEHPSIYMPFTKEPGFFCSDLDIPGRCKTEERYLSLFQDATEQHQRIGDASTNYLYSRVAVRTILERTDPWIIVCLRNPVDMAVSLHGQMLREGLETERSFERAWELQPERAEGREVPRHCPEPSQLLYGPRCALGHQLAALFDLAGRERVLPVLLDDVKADPRREYLAVLDFLDLPDDGRTSFPVANEATTVPPWVSRATRVLRSVRGRLPLRRAVGLSGLLVKSTGKAGRKNQPDPGMTDKLRDYFRSDIERLSELLDRDLSHWHQSAAPSAASASQ